MRIGHRQQEKDYSCGAACLSMVLGIPERQARKLCHTDRSGTALCALVNPLKDAGHRAYRIDLDVPFEEQVANLIVQSERWPLVLSLEYRYTGVGSTGKRRTGIRYHAVVMYRGEIYDPSETRLWDAEAIGHLADKGLTLRSYILIEPKETT